jgi:hypothetical protein
MRGQLFLGLSWLTLSFAAPEVAEEPADVTAPPGQRQYVGTSSRAVQFLEGFRRPGPRDRVARPCLGEVAMSTSSSDDGRRRDFLTRSALAGAAGLLGLRPERVVGEPPPETTTLRIGKVRSVCLAPEYVAKEFLRTEGFTDVQYIETGQASRGVT